MSKDRSEHEAIRAANVCKQPETAATDCTKYCLCKVYSDARQRCIDRGEGRRWGLGG